MKGIIGNTVSAIHSNNNDQETSISWFALGRLFSDSCKMFLLSLVSLYDRQNAICASLKAKILHSHCNNFGFLPSPTRLV